MEHFKKYWWVYLLILVVIIIIWKKWNKISSGLGTQNATQGRGRIGETRIVDGKVERWVCNTKGGQTLCGWKQD